MSRGKICIGFTPDEEVGNGVEYFDIKGFGADYAYTVDGGELGDMSYECFHAASARVTVHGKSVHLVEVFPAGRGQCRREYVETMLLGISCGTLQAETETHHAAGATFRFMLKTMYGVMPMSMVIAIIDDVQAGFFGVADALVQAFAVFAFWKNIRIAVENRRSNAMIYKAFYYG
mgnify:CR=1 FL=1